MSKQELEMETWIEKEETLPNSGGCKRPISNVPYYGRWKGGGDSWHRTASTLQPLCHDCSYALKGLLRAIYKQDALIWQRRCQECMVKEGEIW